MKCRQIRQFLDMLFVGIFCSYVIVNGCYMSVGLFCSVLNDSYSKTFVFGAIVTKNEQNKHFENVFGYDYKHFRMVPKHLRRKFAIFNGSV